MNDVFNAVGTGSSITMFNTAIRDNLIEGNSPFTAVRVSDSATGTVTRSSFTGNTAVSVSRYRLAWLSLLNLDFPTQSHYFSLPSLLFLFKFGYLARQNAQLVLTDVDIIGNTGVAGALTALTYVDDNASLTLNHIIFSDNFVFTVSHMGGRS